MSTSPRHGAGRLTRGLRYACTSLVALCGLLLATPAASQNPYLAITGLRGFVGVRGQGDFEKVRSEGQESRQIDTLVFDERLNLGIRGFVYDPGLLHFSVGGEFGLIQNKTSVDDDERDGDGHLVGWNVHTSFLRERPYNFDVYSFRTTTTQSRDFAGTSETVNEAHGLTANLRLLPMNLWLEVRQEEIDQEFRFAPLLTRLNERRRIARLTGDREWRYQDLDFSYEFNRRDDLVNDQQSFDVQQADLRHRIMFGHRRDNTLTSAARVVDVNGAFDALSFLVTENLDLVHARGLSSHYSYFFANVDLQGNATRTHSGSAILTHQLYDSLTTNLGFNGTTSQLSEGAVSSYGPTLDVSYRKRIPLSGVLSAGTGAGYRLQDQDVPGGIASRFQERHVFADLIPVRLDSSGVIVASIFVTDASGTVLYQEGLDYSVREIGSRVELERNLLGSIPAGGTVLVTYDFQVAPRLRYSEVESHYSLRLDFPWIAAFYTHARSDVRLLEGENVGDFIEDIRSHRAGFELRTATRGRFFASALNTYESYRSERLSYDSFEFNQIVSYQLGRSLTTSLSGGESFFEFSEPERRTKDYYVRGLLSWTPLPGVLCEAFAGMRDQRDSLSADARFLEAGLRARVRVGKFDVDAAYTHAARGIGESESVGDSFRFGMTRWFGQ